MKNINSKLFALILTVAISFFGCSPNEPTPNPPEPTPEMRDTLRLTLTDKTHRSVTLNVKTTANAEDYAKNKIKLIRKLSGGEGQDTLVAEYSAATLDTTIIDDNEGEGLQLETSYVYYAVRIDSANAEKDSSAFVTAQTLGATSHDYMWEEIIIGDDGSTNVLYDVWGTDENNVYAVGLVHFDGEPYGVIRWNGTEWLPEKFGGGPRAIYGFSENDIWVVGNGFWHYDGLEWKEITSDNVINNNLEYTSIWGTSSENLYFGNIWGKIVHWDGSRGALLDIQTNEAIQDIWGFSENEIYAASGTPVGITSVLYRYDDSIWIKIAEGVQYPNEGEFQEPFLTIWGYNKSVIYLGGARIYHWNNNLWVDDGRYFYTVEKIRSNNTNNIVAVGHHGLIMHYNGIDWNVYNQFLVSEKALYSVFVTENKVFTVGSGRIILGKK